MALHDSGIYSINDAAVKDKTGHSWSNMPNFEAGHGRFLGRLSAANAAWIPGRLRLLRENLNMLYMKSL